MKIKLENICKSYKNKENGTKKDVLTEISFDIKEGEMLAICGKSGAGKSTLLHIMGLLDKPSSGMYMWDDMVLSNIKSDRCLSKIRNEKIGFVLQDYGLIEDNTVFDNVSLPLMFGKTKLSEIDKKVGEALKIVGMEKLELRIASGLSGGEKQRTAIARALINNPQLLLCDEPTGALDSENSLEVMNVFKSIKRLGVTIVIVTHDADIAAECDRILKISDGRLFEL